MLSLTLRATACDSSINEAVVGRQATAREQLSASCTFLPVIFSLDNIIPRWELPPVDIEIIAIPTHMAAEKASDSYS